MKAKRANRQNVVSIDPWHGLCRQCPLIRCVEEAEQPTPCPIATAKAGGLSPVVAIAALQMADDDLWVYEELCTRLSAELTQPVTVTALEAERILVQVKPPDAPTFKPADIARRGQMSYCQAHYLVMVAAAAGLVRKVNDGYGGLYRIEGQPFYQQAAML